MGPGSWAFCEACKGTGEISPVLDLVPPEVREMLAAGDASGFCESMLDAAQARLANAAREERLRHEALVAAMVYGFVNEEEHDLERSSIDSAILMARQIIARVFEEPNL